MKKLIFTFHFIALTLLGNSSFSQKNNFVFYLAGNDDSMQILNYLGKPITNDYYEQVGDYTQNRIVVKKAGKYGFIDTNGVVKVPFKFDYISTFEDGNAIFSENEKYGIINLNGTIILKPIYNSLSYPNFPNGLAICNLNGLEGAINKKGKIKIPNEYQYIRKFVKGVATAKKNDKNGVIDKIGKTILPFEYTYLGDLNNGYSLTFKKDNSKYGLIDLKGKVLLAPEYDRVYTYSINLVKIEKNNKMGFADKYGKILLPIEYDDFGSLMEGKISVQKDKKFGFVDQKGTVVIPIIYDAVQDFSEGLAAVLKDGKWGFIDSKGTMIIANTFVGVMNSFYEGYAGYGKRSFSSGGHYTTDKWGMIDKNGNIVIQNKYRRIGVGGKGTFIVDTQDGEKILINKNEETIALLKYEQYPVQMDVSGQ